MTRWWLRLTAYARPQTKALTAVAGLILLGVGVEALRPWPIKVLVDDVLGVGSTSRPPAWMMTWLPGAGTDRGLVIWLAAATVLLFVCAHGLRALQRYLQAGAGSRMLYDLGADLFDRLQRLSLRFHGKRRTGDLVRRVVASSGCVRELLVGVYLPLLTSFASLLVMFAIMWRLDSDLALLALSVAVPVVALIRLFAGPMAQRSYDQQVAEGEVMAYAEQTLTALPMIQSFTRELDGDTRFARITARSTLAAVRAIDSQLLFKLAIGATMALGTATLLWLAGMRVLSGALSIGELVVFLTYLAAMYAPLESLAYLSSGFASAAAGARRVLEVLDESDGVADAADAVELTSHCAEGLGEIRFERVCFGYEPGRPILSDIDLTIEPGETVALVGATGAGKTSLASLVPRLFDPWSGRVLLNRCDLKTVQLASLRSQIAVVLQDTFLLPLSIADNISVGRRGAARAEVVVAAEMAQAASFIEALPHGYDTIIGESGVTLSGGERQRLAIARALLRDAPFLILDEPSASLDAHTEREVMRATERLRSGRTTLVIAHRLSTVREADRIVVLDEGRIVEAGSHTALMAANGAYARQHRPSLGLHTSDEPTTKSIDGMRS